jgi:hypothetical protein
MATKSSHVRHGKLIYWSYDLYANSTPTVTNFIRQLGRIHFNLYTKHAHALLVAPRGMSERRFQLKYGTKIHDTAKLQARCELA